MQLRSKFKLRRAVVLVVLFSGISLTFGADKDIDFGRDIRPLLAENCFACHGLDEKARKAELRLDMPEAALSDSRGAAAIVPGDLAKSEAWLRINSTDEDVMMPPPDSHRKLTDADKAKIQRWIEQGASYAVHWSFIPPVKVALPKVSQPAWVRNVVDNFVMARLDVEGMRPAPEADRRTFIRRVSIDLTGLPPSAEEVEEFVHDRGDSAYEKLVDRLLESPHFGERLALQWLDAARYADTNGFSIDGGRQMWLWRDWVIQAFNSNMPYDRFLVEQIAGDLLPNAGPSQLIATGFQRNNMVTHEGGTIPEENLTNYNADRVKTLGEAVLGLTLGCAQCHDHKYDPITQRDYYQMFAYFNTLSDVGLDGNAGVNPKPFFQAKTVLETDERPEIEAELKALREQLGDPSITAMATWKREQLEMLRQRGSDLQLLKIEPLKVSTPNRGSGFEIENGQIVIAQASDLVAYDVSMKLPTSSEPITGLRVIFCPDEQNGQGWGFGPQDKRPKPKAAKPQVQSESPPEPKVAPTEAAFKGNFVLTSFSASADVVAGDQVNLHRLLPFDQVTANSWQVGYPPEQCLDPRNESGWSPDLGHDGAVHITITFAEPISSAQYPFMTAQLNFGHGKSLVASRFEILAMTGRDDGSTLPSNIIEILVQAEAGELTQTQEEILRDYFAKNAEATKRQRIDIANLEERLRVITEEFPTMVMNVAEKPRPTFVLHRGDYSQPRDEVEAATPHALPQLLTESPKNRLGLARWITMRGHPLTARVTVNQFWQMLFGVGLVSSSADFGAQGQWPSHPELLDWLAVDFLESNWDTKALLRQIVLSATYRQSSATTAELLERDPPNRLLARGPRFRLPAELIRDGALKVSGLLKPRIGGPSVNPYTPGDLWREISHYGSTPATAQAFVQDHGEKLYRRSMYTFWKRTAPPPNMAAFDAPNREVCLVSRPSTTTPLQSLILLNDVQFVEASRAFAERILTHVGDDKDRIEWAVYECLSRPPTDSEIGVLKKALERERTRYAADEKAARDYLSNGESPRRAEIPVVEHAAWSQLAALLLNLSETVTRN